MRRDLIYSEIENNIFSPGDIIWIKDNGNEVVVSKKTELINFSLIQKLKSKAQMLVIENEFDQIRFKESEEIINEFKSAIYYKDKKSAVLNFLSFINRNYVNGHHDNFELNLIFYKALSEVSLEKAIDLVNLDRDYFDRTISVCGAIVMMGMMFGYYDFGYLKKIYNENINGFYNLIKDKSIISAKENLEDFRLNMKKISVSIEQNVDKNFILFEKLDGDGLHGFVENELNDFEITILKINEYFSYLKKNDEKICEVIGKNKIGAGKNVENKLLTSLKELEKIEVV